MVLEYVPSLKGVCMFVVIEGRAMVVTNIWGFLLTLPQTNIQTMYLGVVTMSKMEFHVRE